MAKTFPVIERAGGRVTVLARSAEEAHAAITDELGVGCTIVSVERVRSGGLGGFFATELVRLVAAPRGSEASVPAEAASFASAEELVFALPGGGGEFAARLKEELAVLTAKGVAAAEASMGPSPAGAALIEARRSATPPPPVMSPAAQRAITEPFEQIAPVAYEFSPEPLAMDLGDADLPEADELRWGTEEPARRWRRSVRHDAPAESDQDVAAAAIDVGWTEVEATPVFAGARDAFPPIEVDRSAPEPEATDEFFADQALLAASLELETDQVESFDASFEPAVAEYESASVEPQVWAGRETARTAPSNVNHDHFEGADALLAQMIDAEFEGDDRVVSPRARRIRDGFGNASVESMSAPTPAPIEAEPVEERRPTELSELPTMRVIETTPAPEMHRAPESEPMGRAPLPIRQRMLIPTPVTTATSWSAPTLRAFGVPDSIVERMSAQLPVDDVEWCVSFMLAVRDMCRPVSHAPAVLTGPSCANLARQLGLVSIHADELEAVEASVASPNASAAALRRVSGSRHVHLVVGGGWHHLATVRPTIVSAATEQDLLEALRVAEAWGATLGWTLVGNSYVRIEPFLLAARMRELLPNPAEQSAALGSAFHAAIG